MNRPNRRPQKGTVLTMLFADHTLARRLEGAEVQTVLRYTETKARLLPESGSASLAVGDGCAVFTGRRSPMNRVYGLGMQRVVMASDLAQAEDFFAQRGVSPQVELCPLAHPSLSQHLRDRGYGLLAFKNVWVRPLEELAGLPTPAPHVTVQPVDVADGAMVARWVQTVAGAFAAARGQGPDAEPGATTADAAMDREIALPTPHTPGTVCFLAWVHGQLAGGGALVMEGTLGRCFSTSVYPALQRQGAQGALLHARLHYAAAQGCQLATVQTVPGTASQRNVERFGFRLAYTKAVMGLE